jgi:ParB-like chromosome segregation protein Spo0J
MKIELWPIEKLIPYARNARKIPQTAIDKVAASIKEFGWRQPIVVDVLHLLRTTLLPMADAEIGDAE